MAWVQSASSERSSSSALTIESEPDPRGRRAFGAELLLGARRRRSAEASVAGGGGAVCRNREHWRRRASGRKLLGCLLDTLPVRVCGSAQDSSPGRSGLETSAGNEAHWSCRNKPRGKRESQLPGTEMTHLPIFCFSSLHRRLQLPKKTPAKKILYFSATRVFLRPWLEGWGQTAPTEVWLRDSDVTERAWSRTPGSRGLQRVPAAPAGFPAPRSPQANCSRLCRASRSWVRL